MKSVTPPIRLTPDAFHDVLLFLAPDFPETAVTRLYEATQARAYRPGEFLLREGDACKGVLLVCSGTAQLCLRQGSGKYVELREIASPAILGLNETLLGNSAAASVRAITDVEAVFVPQNSFTEVLRGFPMASLAFSKVVSEDLNSAYEYLSTLRSIREAHGLAVG